MWTCAVAYAGIELNSLNGTNGFAFGGANNNDRCGEHVASAGDINNDGFDGEGTSVCKGMMGGT